MEHVPVLLHEAIDGLNIQPDGLYLDLTIGRAGHSCEILKRLTSGQLIGFDQDKEAINASKKILDNISHHYILVNDNFVNVVRYLKDNDIKEVDGILMDLGVSSPQFDDASRGFSYQKDALLDMRMDNVHNPLTAKEIVNTYSKEELTRIFYLYGEEKYALSIANNIVKKRALKPIETTFELVDIIKKSKPSKELKKIGHPAKQVFQALRIAVNDELNVLEKTLKDLIPYLRKSGGRLAIISFHSGEDRIVKNIFKSYTYRQGDRLNIPTIEKEVEYRLVNRKVITPSQQEIKSNHRSISAKLRILERV